MNMKFLVDCCYMVFLLQILEENMLEFFELVHFFFQIKMNKLFHAVGQIKI